MNLIGSVHPAAKGLKKTTTLHFIEKMPLNKKLPNPLMHRQVVSLR